MDNNPRIAPARAAKITILPTAEEASQFVAERLVTLVQAKPACRLGLATGQTPRRVYAKLVAAVQEGKVSFAEVETINLDEYCGLGQSHLDSFAAYMHRELFSGAGFDPSKINLIDGAAADETAEAARYAALVRSRPADLQLLGIGTNGHIGFNEPGSPATSRVRVVELSQETLDANQPTLLELDRVPKHAITMGIADILDAREIVVLATGTAKAEAIRKSLSGQQDEACPASLLGAHGNVHWVLDEGAAKLL
ncbi:glucosamine-6-phosphate deaminase [Neorhizobium huautlense]|uniref:Glucosamine-6-phosphate deaminase n=1 Tax=Neorhizobium huautlense TaxID=67774 RepID=A0ABT9PP62_9HYPH|nr:glucosamine-6-phosphate deaminase [Neorhizobium huautlense]MDP9836246.1 glucosamine-6-phosphate deaminase [Neorhizobium huautlense]